jgi:predicted transcriptional regulator
MVDIAQRRDRLVILAQMLVLAKDPITALELMYSANLSASQMFEYVKLLTTMGLFTLVNSNSTKKNRAVYKTTEKGYQYLRNYKEIIDLLHEPQKAQAIKKQLKISSHGDMEE